MLGGVNLNLDPVDRGRSTIGGLGPKRYCDRTIVRGSVGSTPSSSYSRREIDPERPSMPVVDIPDSDFETVDGWASTEMDIEEDPRPNFGIPASLTGFYEGSTSGLPVSSPIAETVGSHFPAPSENQIATLQAELARTNRHFPLSCQSRQLETTRANSLAAEVAQIRGTPEFVKGLQVDLQRALAPLPPTSFAATVKAATRAEIGDQMAKQRMVATNASFHPHKRPGQGRWKPQYPKKQRNNDQTGNRNRQNPMIRNPCLSCTYCGREGHPAEVCYKKTGTCFHCGKTGHFAK
ncbi:hypothetical protein M9H77_08997 [Catharanthus roseus]|uniref:Uncharacterized protein n=1 Tax=Catharanthus roseus TaxID=4058 RepID=A0ACC0BZJ5_CATRO|nr:hypothetical protein M9H77_08997 [Catharanthus roseus]